MAAVALTGLVSSPHTYQTRIAAITKSMAVGLGTEIVEVEFLISNQLSRSERLSKDVPFSSSSTIRRTTRDDKQRDPVRNQTSWVSLYFPISRRFCPRTLPVLNRLFRKT